MRHRKGFKQLSRKTGHRKAMMANMAASLIKHKRITTTTTKAKALRGYIEPLITKSKEDTTHSRRVVFSYLQDKDAVSELFREVSPKIMERPGGYTRIIKLDARVGDNAEMAMIELVDFNENLLSETSTKAAGARRRRRGGSKKKEEATIVSGDAATEVSETSVVTSTQDASESIQEAENSADMAEEENDQEVVAGSVEEVQEVETKKDLAETSEKEVEEEKQDENETEEKKES